MNDILDVAIKDVNKLSKEEYALVRKDGFGASDSSVLLGVNLFKDMSALITEKRNKFLTDEEKAVGEKPIVKKGYDLEPIILQKAEEALGVALKKPTDMYRFKDCPILTVNFDGVTPDDIPVEAKLVSKYGEKYYNKDISISVMEMVNTTYRGEATDVHIKRLAESYGIPPYYYTQVQQEIAGLDAPYGYLAAMFDDSWSFKLYKIKRDDFVISKLYVVAENNADKIKNA